ncbi:D-alanyl-D-alanine carboxypeptidase family protein [Falsiroseomonas algicola]|uniref:D-alanyl-D-alanine carboxypeptidase family protein n=1 Tax=Falsiroseomonas algicola TaxID=2716930 RepID=UPI001A990CA6|nr:D-alanyl-D-alanine carboxypeptidase family protein [Falsiroseomonas algicola]
MRFRLGTCAGLVGLALSVLGPAPAAKAQIGSDRYSAIVLDNRTGNVLVQASPDETRHPASLTKMMTLYMVFEALREGRLSLTSAVPISEEAASRPPSKLGLPPGNSLTVEQAIMALVTKSANDVAAAVGERLGGSEERFAQMMTLRARSLGMTRTTFRNASGLPDPDQVTTARDMATLGRRLLQDFPDRYHYFGMQHAAFRGLRLRNHNRMLGEYEGVDGIKTGYIRDSGFNIVTSASRGGQRVVGAVFGGNSWVERDQHMAALLDQSFSSMGITPRPVMARAPASVVRSADAAPAARPARAAAPTTSRQQAVTRNATAARATPRTPPRTTTTARATQPARATPAATTRPATTRPTTRPAAAPVTRTTNRAVPIPTTPTQAAPRIRTAEAR